MTQESPQRKRLILLGASNLTRGFPTVVSTARSLLNSPLEVLACLGHGRSYGMWSTVMGRSLPGILECGMWKAVTDRGPRANVRGQPNVAERSFALITDIGNDVMYGATPAQITNWVEECVNRLENLGARVVINPPPVESIRSIRRWQYSIVRTLLFPTRRLSFEQALSHALELHDRVIDLATRRTLPLIDSEREWYGFDPIHIRRAFFPTAWSKIVGGCVGTNGQVSAHHAVSLREHLHLITRTPEVWRLLRINRGREQPSGRLTDGSTISLF